MVDYRTVAGPHTHSGETTSKLMGLVILALIPTTAYSFYLFGVPAMTLWLTCCAVALLSEGLALQIQNKPTYSLFDGSALLTGWLLALSLPASTPLWMGAFGSAFALIAGKHVFGGLGQNVFNPAMLGRVMLLICFPVELTNWPIIASPELSANGLQITAQWLGTGIDSITSATPLASLMSETKQVIDLSFDTLFYGQHAGSLGETSSLLLLLGGCFLIFKKVITWVIPISLIFGLCLPAAISHLIAPNEFASPLVHLFSGGAMLAAFFIATDMVTSPGSRKGQVIFGLGCGLLIWLIRCFGAYPEGVAFAVLLMNATTPVIDHYLRPTIFGAHMHLNKE